MSRYALALLAIAAAACSSEHPPRAPVARPQLAVTAPLQGLTGAQRDSFHHLPEGDEFIALPWLKSLHNVETKRPFLDDVERFGLIADPSDPDGLPIGLAVATPSDVGHLSGEMVGFSCAACHTAAFTYKGKDIIIEGGAGQVDAERFERELIESMDSTLHTPTELVAFVQRVRTHPRVRTTVEPTDKDINFVTGALRRRFEAFQQTRDLLATVERTDPGYGRIDAFGTSRNLLYAESPIPLTAPVRYPKIWHAYRHKWLHWDGNTNSVMERNIGQAIAAGAMFDPKTKRTTLVPANLHALERLSQIVQPPSWPAAVFGPIDSALAQSGSTLYKDQCARCHSLPGIPERDTIVPYLAVGTDAQRALNAAKPLRGRGYTIVAAELLKEIKDAMYEQHGITAAQVRSIEGERADVEWRVTGGYVARPLTGVWATAPYLHNGSVPTLFDLLQPPSRRPVTFTLGGWEYDPVKVGAAGSKPKSVPFVFDTRITGNSNGGHVYGSSLTDAQRRALLEYLKTL